MLTDRELCTYSLENCVGMCQPTAMISKSIKGLSGPDKSKRVLQVVKNKNFVLCCYKKTCTGQQSKYLRAIWA